MNYRDNNTREPKAVTIEIRTAAGRIITFTNDNITTTCTEDGQQPKRILQNRTAFRGFIGSMTELMGWSLTQAWDSTADTTPDYESDCKYEF